jgi:hypothetical protein
MRAGTRVLDRTARTSQLKRTVRTGQLREEETTGRPKHDRTGLLGDRTMEKNTCGRTAMERQPGHHNTSGTG